MDESHIRKETRQVGGFDQVSIKDIACDSQIYITQGEVESLTIEGPPEYLQRIRSDVKAGKLTIRKDGSWLQELEESISSCFRKPQVIYRLTVQELTHLEVRCAYRIELSQIETPQLRIRLYGAGDFHLGQLTARTIEVHHFGSGFMRVAGKVDEQVVVLNGVGSYFAPDLVSQRAQVRMSGIGGVRLNVSEELDATLRGIGQLEYSGDPLIRRRISGPGRVVRVV